jgi:prepilin-type N-terminal cleavage/methylation domain-containing protein
VSYRSRDGFTLVELLAVVFCIALLAGLLLPVLTNTKTRSCGNRCAFNLKQIGTACSMYADAPGNGGCFPTCSTSSDRFADSNPMLALNLLYNGFIADVRVFSCPKQPTNGQLAGISSMYGEKPTSGVFLSAASCGYGYDPGHRETDVSAIAADKKGTGANSDSHGPNAGQNVLFGGGNVEFRDLPVLKWTDAKGLLIEDADIFGLDAKLPRNEDSYIRQ